MFKKGATIDGHNVKKVPLKDQNFNERFSQTVIPLIQKVINRLLKKGVITAVSEMELGYLSPTFLREKKDNNHRLILNFKELNKFFPHLHFKMDHVKSALNMARKRCFMASVDLIYAYYSVPIENSLQIFFVLQFQEKFYKYACLPNGLTSAPRIFTKIMKPVLSTLRKLGYNVINYLDDIFICGDTFAACRDAVLVTVNLLLIIGFSIHSEKSQLTLIRKIEYLGFLIDYVKMKISLTKTKPDGRKNLIAEVSDISK